MMMVNGGGGGGGAKVLPEAFDPAAVAPEPVPAAVAEELIGNGAGGEEGKEAADGGGKRGIVLGRNVHTTCLAIEEPDANDEFTGDKDAYMAGVLARYRKTLTERTKHHLGNALVACLLRSGALACGFSPACCCLRLRWSSDVH